MAMDGSLLSRRTHDEYWRPVNVASTRPRPQSGLSSARNGRQAAYLALWQQRQSRVQSSRPLGTPRCFVVPTRPPSGVAPRPPSSGLQPRPPPPMLAPQPPPGPPPRPDGRHLLMVRGRVPRRVLSSHFGGVPAVKEPPVDPEKRVRLVSPPSFNTPEVVESEPLPWRRIDGREEEKDEEREEEENTPDSDEGEISDELSDSEGYRSSETPTPPPTPLRLKPRPPAHPRPPDASIRSILKRARMREARLAPPTAYIPSPLHGPVPQETELTDILSIRPKPMVPHVVKEASGRSITSATRVTERGVRFNMANTEVIEIARRRPQLRPSLFPDSYRLT